ncbi:hypothetical protein [Catenovulum sediminis]|uniref:hypothetical protein n=1 Tax=Catenovulum sediminis TaxID=1740262 RepID=UPI0011812DF2|nr:hypothetical protein [Catenovulum sediminis]
MSDMQLLSNIGLIVAYLFPVFFILKDNSTKGHEKNIWLIGVMLFSWFIFAVYLLVVPKVLDNLLNRAFPDYLYRKP